jgi:hypothetical protein
MVGSNPVAEREGFTRQLTAVFGGLEVQRMELISGESDLTRMLQRLTRKSGM